MHRTIRAAALAAAIAGLALGAGACAKRQTTSTDQALGGPVAGAPAGPGMSTPGAGAGATQPGATARTLPGGATGPGAAGPGAMAPAGSGPGGGTTIAGPTGPGSTTYYGGSWPGATSGLADVFFGFDEATLSAEARQILDRNAEYLRQNPKLRVQIEGHADERGSTAYNLALGDRRATAARRYLESLGIDASRLSTISYGEEKPFAQGSTEEAWAQNRRGHFVELR